MVLWNENTIDDFVLHIYVHVHVCVVKHLTY